MNRQTGTIAAIFALLISAPAFAGTIFDTGNLVVSVEGCGIEGGSASTCAVANGTGTAPAAGQNSTLGGYGDNQAGPLTLFQFTTSGTYVNSLVLPQTTVAGGNYAVSGEYGSSSEGTLQLSGNGQYLTIAGYGVNAAAFNANPLNYGGTGSKDMALGQSTDADVPRTIALIDANGNVNSTTALTNVFNTNNPRSVYTVNGTSFYISGQGQSSNSTASGSKDASGGVFYVATVGSTTATTITGTDAGSGHSQDTNEVQIYNNTLYVSADATSGSPSRSFVGTLGTAGTPPISCGGGSSGCPPTQLPGFGLSTGSNPGTGQLTLSAGQTNTINASGDQINLSPENYWFANSTTLYVADDGAPKQTSGTSNLGDGGLQKWSLVSGSWVLDYTLSTGLDLVENPTADASDTDGSTGLYGLTGELIDGGTEVELFATNSTIADLDQTYLYGIVDVLADTTNPGTEDFTVIATAPADSNFKGVSFAPTATPEPSTFLLFGCGIAALPVARRRKAA
jgi:hypothetical protein